MRASLKVTAFFGLEKSSENTHRDRRNRDKILCQGWNVIIVCKCQLIKIPVETITEVVYPISQGNEVTSQRSQKMARLSEKNLLEVAEQKVHDRLRHKNDRPVDDGVDATMTEQPFIVVDLFSGAGGMSYGFSRHPSFRVKAAADAEIGKPSTGEGKLQCNTTYFKNLGIVPSKVNLSQLTPSQIRPALRLPPKSKVHVLLTCPPCTGFSRAIPQNHLRDDMRNNLVRKSANFAVALDADIVVMENARELLRGNFTHHYDWFRKYLENREYNVFGRPYMLSRFGLPQIRERAIIIAAKQHLPLHTLESLWDGWGVKDEALTVRRAFASIDPSSTGVNLYPSFAGASVQNRLSAIPKDGGSWIDLLNVLGGDQLLTDAMKRILAEKRVGSYPDVYGRMAWDKPAPTIKRECSHIGNGRYAHPEEDRLCSIREMAILQGFPNDFVFNDAAVSNMYRHIGDAVPPLVSYQLAHLCHWILTGKQPAMKDIILKGTNLTYKDIVKKSQGELHYA